MVGRYHGTGTRSQWKIIDSLYSTYPLHWAHKWDPVVPREFFGFPLRIHHPLFVRSTSLQQCTRRLGSYPGVVTLD